MIQRFSVSTHVSSRQLLP